MTLRERKGTFLPEHEAHAAPRRKLRFEQIVRAIRAHRDALEEADAVNGLDRRVVLARLCAALDAEEELLLLRGFDRAYRRVIEGV
jgi:hypothetical protein